MGGGLGAGEIYPNITYTNRVLVSLNAKSKKSLVDAHIVDNLLDPTFCKPRNAGTGSIQFGDREHCRWPLWSMGSKFHPVRGAESRNRARLTLDTFERGGSFTISPPMEFFEANEAVFGDSRGGGETCAVFNETMPEHRSSGDGLLTISL